MKAQWCIRITCQGNDNAICYWTHSESQRTWMEKAGTKPCKLQDNVLKSRWRKIKRVPKNAFLGGVGQSPLCSPCLICYHGRTWVGEWDAQMLILNGITHLSAPSSLAQWQPPQLASRYCYFSTYTSFRTDNFYLGNRFISFVDKGFPCSFKPFRYHSSRVGKKLLRNKKNSKRSFIDTQRSLFSAQQKVVLWSWQVPQETKTQAEHGICPWYRARPWKKQKVIVASL